MNVQWTDRSLKDLEDLEDHIAQRIIDKVEDASHYPDHYLSPLRGYDLYKIRIGNYRAIVSIDNEKMIVVTTDHRKNIYKSLNRFYD